MNAWDRRNAWLFRNDQTLVSLFFFAGMFVLGALGRMDDVAYGRISEQGTQAAVAVDVMMNAGIVVMSLAFVVPLVRSVRRDWARIA